MGETNFDFNFKFTFQDKITYQTPNIKTVRFKF